MIKRIAPALSLLLLSPLIAEFLLGDFSIRQLGYLAIFVPLYGASALFIREVVRRTNRGWPTILTTAAVFGLLMERHRQSDAVQPELCRPASARLRVYH